MRDIPQSDRIAELVGGLHDVKVLWHEDRALLRHVGGKLRIHARSASANRPGDARRVHARGRARLHRDRRAAGARRALHDDLAERRDLYERHTGARPGQYRTGRVDARDGGQGGVLRPVRRDLGDADPDRRHRRRHVRQHRPADRADVRRDPPRGHLGPGMLRDRAAAEGGAAAAGHARRRPRHRRRVARGGDRRLPLRRNRVAVGDGRPARPRRRRVRDRGADGRRRRAPRARVRSDRGVARAGSRARGRDHLDGTGDGGGRRGRGDDRQGRADPAGDDPPGPGDPRSHEP